MRKYRFKVSQLVEVPAHTAADAFEVLQEVFGIGEEYGITVTDCEYEELSPPE